MNISHIEHIGVAVKSLEVSIPQWELLLGSKCYRIEEVEKKEIIPAPVITDAESYAVDRTRRKIIMARRPDNRRVIDDSIEALNRVIAARE